MQLSFMRPNRGDLRRDEAAVTVALRRPFDGLAGRTLAACAALAGVAISAQAQQPLDAKAAANWYAGVTVEGTTADGQSFRAFHDPAGRMKALVAGQYSNDGAWSVRDDGAVCVDWRDVSWGRKPCFWIKEDRNGEWLLERVDDPKNVTRVKRIEGNKYNM